MAENESQSRRAVTVMDRAALEDKHLQLMEENLLLKKHARSQEEKMKKMATKLLRLTADGKKEACHGNQTGCVRSGRELELEVKLEEMKATVDELERKRAALKNKVLVLRQQLDAKGKRHTPYDHVQSRISTGLSRNSQRSVSTEDVSTRRPAAGVQTNSPSMPRYGHSLLEEARKDNLELEELVLQLKHELALLHAKCERDKEQFKLREVELEEGRVRFEEQLQLQLMAAQKTSMNDGVEFIKLQRELREKSSQLQSLQMQTTMLENSLAIVKEAHSKALQEMEALNSQLKMEQVAASRLQVELKANAISLRSLTELQDIVSDLKAERELLKQSNDRLMKSALENDKDQQHKIQIKTLQDRIRMLEASVQNELSEKAKVLDSLAHEREVSQSLDKELREALNSCQQLRAVHSELKAEHERLREEHRRLLEDHTLLKEKLDRFNKIEESSLDWGEIQEALVLLRQHKEKAGFSPRGDSNDEAGLRKEILELQVAHADTINELEKTRKLLSLQHSVNKGCTKEITELKSHENDLINEYESKLQEMARLLDIKSARVQQLDSKLKSIAYGTQTFKFDAPERDSVSEGSIQLDKGQNLLQFHVSQVLLSSEALMSLNTSNPAVFLTLSYSDFETQVTPVIKGARPQFNYTAHFVVTVDNKFIEQLQKEVLTLELHQAIGMKHERLGMAKVKLRELAINGGDQVNARTLLMGVDRLDPTVTTASMEYWFRMKLPITQSARLHRMRNRAVELMASEKDDDIGSTPGNYNELIITIQGCKGLKRSPSNCPNPYAMYKFHTFPDSDTPIVPNTQEPQFADTQVFPVTIDQTLDCYLRRERLSVYLFDDLAPVETSCMGVAEVPLLPLAENRSIDGLFALKEPNIRQTSGRDSVGLVELSIRWKQPYSCEPLPTDHAPNKREQVNVKTTEQQHVPGESEVVKKEMKEDTNARKQEDSRKRSETRKGSEMKEGAGGKGGLEKEGPGPDMKVIRKERPGPEVDIKKEESGPEVKDIKKAGPGPEMKVIRKEGPEPEMDIKKAGSGPEMKEIRKEGPGPEMKVIRKEGPEPEMDIKKAGSGPEVKKEGSGPEVNIKKQGPGPEVDIKKEGPGPEVKDIKKEGPGPEMKEIKKAGSGPEVKKEGSGPEVDIKKQGPGPEVDIKKEGSGPEMRPLMEEVKGTPKPTRSSFDDEDEEEEVEEREEREAVDEREGKGENGDKGEEEIQLSEEDTMFEETAPSDRDGMSPSLITSPSPPRPSASAAEASDEESGSEHSVGNPITSGIPLHTKHNIVPNHKSYSASSPPEKITLTVHSISVEAGSSLARDSTITQLFVEFQFLNYDYKDLDTISVKKPVIVDSAPFNFTKVFDFTGNPNAKLLLAEMLKADSPADGKIIFTVVSDPESVEDDCVEVGNAELDLRAILEEGDPMAEVALGVLSLQDEPELVGHLTVSVQLQ